MQFWKHCANCYVFFVFFYFYFILFFEFSFPQATNQTLLDKFKRQHEDDPYIEFPAVMEPAFIIKHYAGKVKYGVKVSTFLARDAFCLLKSNVLTAFGKHPLETSDNIMEIPIQLF